MRFPVSLLLLVLLALVRGAEAQQPNFILVYADDLRRDDALLMPSIEAHLIKGGLSFERYYTGTPLCSPSRSSLLRGQYAHNTGVLTNRPSARGGWEEWRRRDLGTSTLATWLQGVGYRTAFAGKFLNFYPSEEDQTQVDPGWDSWFATHSSHRGSRGLYYNYQATADGVELQYGEAPEDHSNDVTGRRIYDFILQSLAGGDPFFVYLAPHATHADEREIVSGDNYAGYAIPAPRHIGAFAGYNAPRAPSFNEADMRDKPSFLRLPPLDAFATARVDTLFQARAETLLSVDEWIGRYVAALDSAGALDNTYILFASDQGFMYGEHRQPPEDKNGPYEESVHMPLFVRGPGVTPGTATGALALNIDLAPTIAELAGAPVPDFVDGRSLVPFLQGQPPPTWRNVVYGERWNRYARLEFDLVRADSVKLIRSFGTRWLELYHLDADSFEVDGLPRLADRPLLDSLRAAGNRLAACAGASCRTADQVTFLDGLGFGPQGSLRLYPPGLSAPVPNPASGTATLYLTVGRPQHVEVAAYDVLGRRAAVLFAGAVDPGQPQRLALSTADVAAGVYVVRATGVDFTASQRVTLLR